MNKNIFLGILICFISSQIQSKEYLGNPKNLTPLSIEDDEPESSKNPSKMPYSSLLQQSECNDKKDPKPENKAVKEDNKKVSKLNKEKHEQKQKEEEESNKPQNSSQQTKTEPKYKPLTPLDEHTSLDALPEKKTEVVNIARRSIPKWLMKASISNAPAFMQCVLNYLQSLSLSPDILIPSFHHMILVGPPGTGKTTLAIALGQALNWNVEYIQATALLGQFRNQTAVNIRSFFKKIAEVEDNKVVVIDEIHKLFEKYADEKTDHAENAATFWLLMDLFEKRYPNIIIIGTANDATLLPPEIKSRFFGRIITLPEPDNQQKIKAFKEIIANDLDIEINRSITDEFIASMLIGENTISLRDIQSFIDTAKMFHFFNNPAQNNSMTITLNSEDFKKSFEHLTQEKNELVPKLEDRLLPFCKKWGTIIGAALNTLALAKVGTQVITKLYTLYQMSSFSNFNSQITLQG